MRYNLSQEDEWVIESFLFDDYNWNNEFDEYSDPNKELRRSILYFVLKNIQNTPKTHRALKFQFGNHDIYEWYENGNVKYNETQARIMCTMNGLDFDKCALYLTKAVLSCADVW